MFDTVNAQQQPYIQSGYGAMSRLNTLLGLGGAAGAGGGGGGGGAPAPGPGYRPTPGGGVQPILQAGPSPNSTGIAGGNMRLKRLLALRAANGDTESARMLGQV